MPLYIYAINGLFGTGGVTTATSGCICKGSETRRALKRKAVGAQAPGEGPGLGNTSGTRHVMEHNVQGSRSGET